MMNITNFIHLKVNQMSKIKYKILLLCLLGFSANIIADTLELEGYKAYKEKRYPEAIDLWTKSCDADNLTACYELGVLYDVTDGVKQDKVKAAKLYKKSCDGGLKEGCYAIALAYDNGDGVKKSRAHAIEYFSKACEGGDDESCFNLGSIFYNGGGVKKNIPKALHFFKKACDFGNENGCNNERIIINSYKLK